jgi:hypothetical protein
MTRLANAEYYQRQCANWFPPQGGSSFASSRGKTEVQVNAHTGGWTNTLTTRVLFSNGEFDPWRSASVSSAFRPGGPLNGTADVPVFLINGSRHCNDLSKKNAINPAIAAVQDAELKQMSAWVANFSAQRGTGSGNSSVSSVPTSRGSERQNKSEMHLAFAFALVLTAFLH